MRYSFSSAGITAVALFAATGAAQPTQLSGHYDFDCSSANLTVSLLLSGGHGSRSSISGGELVVPVFCNNNTTYDWDDYQLRLDNAELDFNDACNSIVSDLNLPPSLEDCSTVAAEWRQGLEELNDKAAGLVPVALDVTVREGTLWNWFLGWWPTYSNLVLANGDSITANYGIGRYGKVWIANIAPIGFGQTLIVFGAACYGGLAAVSEGRLNDEETSWLTTDYGGALGCGVHVGPLWLHTVATVALSMRVDEMPDL